MKLRSTLMTALAVTALGAGFTPVHADESIGVSSKVVSYADLNLDSDVGAKALYSRIRSAAKLVCSGYSDRDLVATRLRETCIDKAVASAVAQVNNSKLNAMDTHGNSNSSSARYVASR
jgi:UrcA family protein